MGIVTEIDEKGDIIRIDFGGNICNFKMSTALEKKVLFLYSYKQFIVKRRYKHLLIPNNIKLVEFDSK